MTRARRHRAVQLREEIVRIAHAGADVPTLRRRILPLLQQLLAVDAVWWALADPDTLLFSQPITDDIPSTAGPLFLENEIAQADVNKFRWLARNGDPVATLFEATAQKAERSARYRDILRPHRMGDEMRAALRDRGRTWGFMCLHREAGAPAFSRDEQAWMRRLAPHVASGVRHSLLLGRRLGPRTTGTGVLVLSEDGDTISATPDAERLLSDLPGWPEDGPRTLAVRSLVSRLRTIDAAPDDACPPPRVRVRSDRGEWMTLSASRLSSSPGKAIAIVIEPTRLEELVPLQLATAGLTGAEANVARLTVQGLSNKEIAQSLGITALTVQQHLKAVFAKTHTHSRGELIGRLSRP